MIIDSRYEVIEQLMTDLWSIVYKVKDTRTDKIYSLKLFHNLDANSLYEKFSAEQMYHITKIDHPNLLKVHDFGNFGSNVYYIREHYEGHTLRYFKFIPSNVELVYDIIVQICYAFNALHSQKIIHKDFKLENVAYKILRNQVDVRVMDYGFAKLDFSEGGQKIGSSLPFVAPEIYLDNNPVPQSDYYSLGVILYRLTTGALPYTVEQITGFIAGNEYNLFPKFPRELNPDIPDSLEKIILKLLERNPEDRFPDAEAIISYINQIQLKQYPYSKGWTFLNNIKMGRYFARENYAHQLLDFIPLIEQGNGKLVVLAAGKGMGKTNTLMLFRYHLLTDEYYIFDYECSSINRDPFFALIKEFHNAVRNNEKLASDLSVMSEKLKEYLFGSEQSATMLEQDEEELDLDFITASNFVYHLSEEKPIIFIIRAAQHLTKDDIDFVNYISKDLMNRRILIILSVNDIGKIEGLIHTVQIKIEPLNLAETKELIKRLLNVEPPEQFVSKIRELTYGNPMFIESILWDLAQQNIIFKDNKFILDYDFEAYALPEDVVHSVFERMSHLGEQNYKYLQQLGFVKTPLSNPLIKHVLDISEKEVFFLLRDAMNNELLEKRDKYYYFTYRPAQERFSAELTYEEKQTISHKILEYFSDKTFYNVSILLGVIEHAQYIEDFKAVRDYKLKLVALYAEKGKEEEAFEEICSIAELDFTTDSIVSVDELKSDLKLLVRKLQWGTVSDISDDLKDNIKEMKNIAEKHYTLGSFYLETEQYAKAQKSFEKALSMVREESLKKNIYLQLGLTHLLQNDLKRLQKCVQNLENMHLNDEEEMAYVGLKALHTGFTETEDEAIGIIEEYLPKIKSSNDANFFIKLGTLHNYLAYLYSEKKMLDEANKNYQITRQVWEQANYQQKLGIVYNNIGDVALNKGDTKTAHEYFLKAYNLCKETGYKRAIILTIVNLGQLYIKLGQFQKAEEYLNEAYQRTLKHEKRPFYDSIIHNLAISKSKIHNFKYYLDFIKEHAPELLKNKISTVNPLVKTYFYYLHQIGDYDRMSTLLKNSENIFLEKREEEFFYQMLGFVAKHKGKLDEAGEKIELAFNYAKQNNNLYAQSINYIRIVEYYLGIGELSKAKEIAKLAERLCKQNEFHYWRRVLQIKLAIIKLLDEKVSFRKILRELLNILDEVQEKKLFLLEIDCYALIVQIYTNLNVRSKAKEYFKKYKTALNNAAEGISSKEKELFLQKHDYYIEDVRDFSTVKIVPRIHKDITKWQEELYDILKLKELDRIKFLMCKTIDTIFSPHYFAIVLQEELINASKPFLLSNVTSDYLFKKDYRTNLKKAIDANEIIREKINGNHVCFVPLRIKNIKVGGLILADRGELDFLKDEMEIIKILRFHLTSILIRIKEFAHLNNDMELMTKLINMTQKFYSIFDLDKLEQEIVSFTIDFINGSRGFFIKKDVHENYIYKVAMDESKHLVRNYAYISKHILSEVQRIRQSIYVSNVKDETAFDEYLDFDYDNLSVYCAPFIIDNLTYGYIYIDNYGRQEDGLSVNPEFMRLLLIQISVALKNAMQYQSLLQKNREIMSIDRIKQDFLSITSHELKTPLQTLQGYVNRLSDTEMKRESQNLIDKISNNVEQIHRTVNDIINYNRYKLMSELGKAPVDISELLEVVAEETTSLSATRHMQINTEIEEELPKIALNWEAFYLVVYNLVLNSIRFTKDFGTIVLGARQSAFQQEKIDSEDSLIVYVQDNGIGIPKHEQENIFKELYELTEVNSHSSGLIEFGSSGLGLGLATAKLIVNLHKGKIWVNSKENEGTTVFIALPYKHS